MATQKVWTVKTVPQLWELLSVFPLFCSLAQQARVSRLLRPRGELTLKIWPCRNILFVFFSHFTHPFKNLGISSTKQRAVPIALSAASIGEVHSLVEHKDMKWNIRDSSQSNRTYYISRDFYISFRCEWNSLEKKPKPKAMIVCLSWVCWWKIMCNFNRAAKISLFLLNRT